MSERETIHVTILELPCLKLGCNLCISVQLRTEYSIQFSKIYKIKAKLLHTDTIFEIKEILKKT